MGVSLGTGSNKHTVDVEINVVPFIDLLSCLVAYLIVTAVWVELSQIEIEPRGLAKDGVIDEVPAVTPGVLITSDAVWVGTSLGARTRIAPVEGQHDWRALERELTALREQIDAGPMLEIAADDEITYQTVVDAMDVAVAVGWGRVGYVDPASLGVKFVE